MSTQLSGYKMADMRNTDSGMFYWAVDFAVLGITFFVSWMLFSVGSVIDLAIHLAAYSIIVLLFVRVFNRVAGYYIKLVGEASRKILGNGTGILVGTCVVLLLEKQFSASGQLIFAIIFASVMAFFVLGTLSPIVRKTPIVHRRSSSF